MTKAAQNCKISKGVIEIKGMHQANTNSIHKEFQKCTKELPEYEKQIQILKSYEKNYQIISVSPELLWTANPALGGYTSQNFIQGKLSKPQVAAGTNPAFWVLQYLKTGTNPAFWVLQYLKTGTNPAFWVLQYLKTGTNPAFGCYSI